LGLHGKIFQDAFLGLGQAIMIFVQDYFGLIDISPVSPVRNDAAAPVTMTVTIGLDEPVAADGTPEHANRDTLKRWVEVCEREFMALQQQAKQGQRTFLDAYGATDEAEFFAVITGQFFDEPQEMRSHHPDLYDLLQSFYRQDPAARVNAKQ
jgi:hypothetical protein